MKIILSPAKKMIVDTDNLVPVELPVYIDKTAEVLNWIKSKSKEELKAIWKCNDKIAEQNFNRLENMDLYNRLTPAVLAYEGNAFQYMAPVSYTHLDVYKRQILCFSLLRLSEISYMTQRTTKAERWFLYFAVNESIIL